MSISNRILFVLSMADILPWLVFGIAGKVKMVKTSTPAANATMQEIHDRMPVILEKTNIAAWLDPSKGQSDLLAMLESYLESLIELYPVSSKVNSPRNNGPECVERSLPGASS